MSGTSFIKHAVLQTCTSVVGNAMPGPEFQQARLWIDEQIALYVNYVGACERIYKTPIPIAFTVRLFPVEKTAKQREAVALHIALHIWFLGYHLPDVCV